jgi:DNA-binding response OmpR family regulator
MGFELNLSDARLQSTSALESMPLPEKSDKANASAPSIQFPGNGQPETVTEWDSNGQRAPFPNEDSGNDNTQGHILVVDDDAFLLRLLVKVLSRTGYRVESADDGASGWNALSVKRFDLLLTDYSMPNLNGLELLRKVWNSPSRVPAILMSASMPQDVGEILELVAPGGVLHKPFAIAELLFKVGTILDNEPSRTGDADDAPQSGVKAPSRRRRKAIENEARLRLKSLASKILIHESGAEHAGEAAALSIFNVCDKLRRPVQTLTGEKGYRSILGRALMLSRPEAAWLEPVEISPEVFFHGLRQAESQVTQSEAVAGETALVTHLLDLLFTFIGEQMTRTLLQDIWPECLPMS